MYGRRGVGDDIVNRFLSKIGLDPSKNIYDKVFIYLLIASAVLGVLWLDKPEGSLIFDEKYYVNVARIILRLPHDPDVYENAPLGLDPNHEHPFIGKGLIALSTAIFGDNAYGWRIPSVVFGIMAILIMYLLIKKASGKSSLALFATFLFAFDNLVYVHSRIATLDIFMLTFMLLGFYLYFTNRLYLSAISMALSTLCKLGGLYGFAVIIVFHLARNMSKHNGKTDWRAILDWIEKYTLTYIATGLIILVIVDRLWVGYQNPFDHMAFIYKYTGALKVTAPRKPNEIWSYPWEWLLNRVEIPYLKVDVNVLTNHEVSRTYSSILFKGAMNPLIIFLTIPSMIYVGYAYYETKDQVALFALIWFALTYFPFYPMSIIGHRIMYLFYFLNSVPSVCLAIAYLFLDQKPPRIILLVYCIAVLVGFGLMFPFKTIP
jgi:predicted membrane-bound dolichyl-phosphate-mannose-protein mannosyltransferase